jgi:hypothetical protein
VRVWPKGAQLPPSFLQTNVNAPLGGFSYPKCLREEGPDCDLVPIDLTADGKPEIIMLGPVSEPLQ